MEAHLDAIVLVGAQAVYLRTQGRLVGYQAFTTDADVVLDPAKLGPIPPLGQAMEAAGFTLTDEPGIWEAHFARPAIDDEVVVPIDLIVPEQLAPRAGRRSARLPGQHGKAHKLGERLATPQRLKAKDAGDVYRLFDAAAPDEMAALLTNLLADERSAQATATALGFLRQLFETPASTGTQLAADALQGTLPSATVVAVITGYTRELLNQLEA